MPAPKAQDNFTDPDSRIMKTSAGFEQCFNAQTAVDAHTQIVVAAELTNCAADSGELPGMLDAVQRNMGHAPEVALADAGYRSEAVLAQLSESPTEVIVALGREGKKQVDIDAGKLPHTAAMAAKLQSDEGRAKHPQAQGHRGAAQRLDQTHTWLSAVQLQGHREGSLRVQAGVRGAELASHGQDDGLKRRSGPNMPA